MVAPRLPGPQTALRPARPLLVYLDLNKWIDLAHAETGTNKGKQFASSLAMARDMVAGGNVIFPLSFAHFMEVAKIGNDCQRRTLAQLMVRLSQGWFLPSASSLIAGELRSAIARQFGRPFSEGARWALTRSIKTVFGDPQQLAEVSDFHEELFQSPWVLEEFLATARIPREFFDNFQTFADQHEAGRALRWDTSREVRKRAYCVKVTNGILARLIEALADFGLRVSVLEEIGPEGCVALLESIPLLDVEINLHVERNEHRDRKVAANDEIDLGFLSLAIPYCHVVVTERFWTDVARRLRLDQKYETLVACDLKEVLGSIRAEGSHTFDRRRSHFRP